MKNTMEYKGYVGSVEQSEYDSSYYGKILGIEALILYEGKSPDELEGDFHEAVDVYLENCKEHGEEPERPYKGHFNVRIGSDLHRSAAIYAIEHNQSLNSFVEEAIRQKLACM